MFVLTFKLCQSYYTGLTENQDFCDSLSRGVLRRKRSDGNLYSSDDSLNTGIQFVPNFVTDYSQEYSAEYSDYEDSYNNNPINYSMCSTNDYRVPPTFSFTDYDEAHSTEIRSACKNLGLVRHREQSVDSSQSYDSDCSYPECMKKMEENCTYSYYVNADKKSASVEKSYEQQLCQQTMESMKISDKHSGKSKTSQQEYDEIPYIDDETDSTVDENETAVKPILKRNNIPIIKIMDVDGELENLNEERKNSCDIGVNVDFTDFSANNESSNFVEVQNSLVNNNSNAERSDFLGKSPSDQNFFSENFSVRKNNSKNGYFNHIKINIDKDDKNITCNKTIHCNRNGIVKNKSNICFNEFNEYNILDNNSESPEIQTKNNIHVTNTSNSNSENSIHTSKNDGKCKISFNSTSKSVFENKPVVSLSKTSFTGGKVKALAKRFNDINLTYQAKLHKRNCQSTPDVSHCGVRKERDITQTTIISSSLDTFDFPSKENIEKASPKNHKYSSEEQKKLQMLLEDWSKYGSKSELDDVSKIKSEDNDHKQKIVVPKNITIKSSLILKTNFDNKKPSNVTNKLEKPNKIIKSPLNKQFGSLEKLTGSTTPRNLDFVSCKSFSSPSINKSTKKPVVAIEKTKLVIPRKKFPQSYIVKKKQSPPSGRLIYPASFGIVQSCPNLIPSNQRIVSFPRKHVSCSDISKTSHYDTDKPSYMKICRIRNKNLSHERPPTPRFAWIQYGPNIINAKKSFSYEDISKLPILLVMHVCVLFFRIFFSSFYICVTFKLFL